MKNLISNVALLNSYVKQDGFFEKANKDYIDTLTEIAKEIAEQKSKKPIILISGPSGSGKTTTALTIGKILDEMGVITHTLSLDNYFKTITDEEKILLEKGELDLESPNRVDEVLLNEQLGKMIQGEPVELPKYDFTAAKRVLSGKILHRKKGELVILEGIHALNPDVVTLPSDETYKIYISVRTRVRVRNTILHPCCIRLMRRMIRDKIYRGRAYADTLKMFESVELGEEKYIMPYKHRSDHDIDTFIPYELSVYRPKLLEELQKINTTDMVDHMVEVLAAAEPIDEEQVPTNSLIREFIGNGHFEY